MPTVPKLMSCTQGHFWENPEDRPAAACPVCGGPPESLPLIALPEAGPAAPAAKPPPQPARRGRPAVPGYEIVEERGRTPAGVAVYLAKQPLVPRSVLLKVVLAAEDRGQRAWGALRGEAVALAKVAHPNVVQLYEAGERNRELFYNAVEFVDGPTLAQKWSAKPLPFRQAAALVEVLARAVQFAHEQGVVHRALRPAAVQLQLHKSEGRTGAVAPPFCLVHSMRCVPKLTDFGLARRPVEGDVNDLDLQQGLPSYLSPEQVWGRAKDIGPATDVYALGAILYELVSGEPPFLGPTLSDTLDLIQTRPAAPPGSHRAGVPADLGAVCLRCLEKSPRKRYASAEALADDLRRFLDGLPVKARRPGAVGRAWRAARRRPAVAFLLALTLGLAAALATVTARPGRPRPAPAVPGVAYPRPPQPAPVAPAVERRDDLETVYYRSLALAQRAAGAGDEARALRYLERCPAHLRQWEWLALEQQARRADRVRWPRPDAPVSALACSPDGNHLAALGYDAAGQSSVVTVWGGPDDPVAAWRPSAARRTALAWAPDSTRLLTIDAAGEQRQFWKTGRSWRDAGTPLGNSFPATGPHQTAVMAPRGAEGRRWLVCVVDGAQVRVRDGDHRQPPRVLAGAGVGVVAIACCPETNAFATGDRDGVVRIWDLPTGRLLATLEGHTAPVTALAFAPGGRRLVSGGRDDALCVWDPASGREVLRLPGPAGGPTALAFRPDGRRLVVARDFDITEWGDGPIRWDEIIRNGPP